MSAFPFYKCTALYFGIPSYLYLYLYKGTYFYFEEWCLLGR
jgi:hypothetical protein